MNKSVSKGDDFTDLEYYRDVFDAYEVKERLTVITIGVLSIIANSLVLFAMFTTRKIRKNSASSFIFAILSIDLLFGYWFTYFFYFEVSNAETKDHKHSEELIVIGQCDQNA
jgi:FlaA1/EpsC-like NDP-sugar epimerase